MYMRTCLYAYICIYVVYMCANTEATEDNCTCIYVYMFRFMFVYPTYTSLNSYIYECMHI